MTTDIKKQEYRLLFLIVSQKLAPKAQEILDEDNIPMHYHIVAKGTASGELLDIIGLGELEKTIVISMLTKEIAEKLLSKLKNKLYLGTPNTGIAFTIPISGGSATAIQLMQVLQADTVNTERTEIENMENKYVMVMAFVNQGFSEEVMAAAKPAGAGGGTVFHSRRVCNEESVKLWGITIQPEREIVLILANEDKKVPIMRAITEKCGIQSDAHGIVISLPVDEVAGLNKYESLSL